LIHVPCPIVIVECGFLSNSAEANLLSDPSYQDKIAWTLHMGILQYLNGESS
ncbi:MAG: N-acetylmuramoyl-L-alanine amidase, partial [Lachnospiraceae bacterium]